MRPQTIRLTFWYSVGFFILFFLFFSCAKEADWPAVYKQVSPSIVSIRVDGKRFSRTGSGFFIKKQIIATNFHVIADAQTIKIQQITGNKEYLAKVIAIAPDYDLALIETHGLVAPFLKLSDDYLTGEEIRVIGNPEGYTGTITSGNVSAIRSVKDITFIQTDAAINPGNSGGPVINRQGRVIGMATLKMTDAESLGFCVSSKDLSKLIDGKIGKWVDGRPSSTSKTIVISAAVICILFVIFFIFRLFTSRKRKPASPADISGKKKPDVTGLQEEMLSFMPNLSGNDFYSISHAVKEMLPKFEKINSVGKKLQECFNTACEPEIIVQNRYLLAELDKIQKLSIPDQAQIQTSLEFLEKVDQILASEPGFYHILKEFDLIFYELTELKKCSQEKRYTTALHHLENLIKSDSYIQIKQWVNEYISRIHTYVEKSETLYTQAQRAYDQTLFSKAEQLLVEALKITADFDAAKALLSKATKRNNAYKKLITTAEQRIRKDSYFSLKTAVKKLEKAGFLSRESAQKVDELTKAAQNALGKKDKSIRKKGIAAAVAVLLLVTAIYGFERWQAYKKYNHLISRVSSVQSPTEKLNFLHDYLSCENDGPHVDDVSRQIKRITTQIDQQRYFAMLDTVSDNDSIQEKIAILKNFLTTYPETSFNAQIKQDILDYQLALSQKVFDEIIGIARQYNAKADFEGAIKILEDFKDAHHTDPHLSKIDSEIHAITLAGNEHYYNALSEKTFNSSSAKLKAYKQFSKDHPDSLYKGKISKEIQSILETVYKEFKLDIAGIEKKKLWDDGLNLCYGALETLKYSVYESEINTLITKYKKAISDQHTAQKEKWNAVVSYVDDNNRSLKSRIQKVEEYLALHKNSTHKTQALEMLEQLKTNARNEQIASTQRKSAQSEQTKWERVLNSYRDNTIDFCTKAETIKRYLSENPTDKYKSDALSLQSRCLNNCAAARKIRTAFQNFKDKALFVCTRDGVVFDKRTGLYWNFIDSQVEFKRPIAYQDAQNYISYLNTSSGVAWRLPTSKELQTLFNSKTSLPVAPPPHYFAKVAGYSSSMIPLVFTSGSDKGHVGKIERYANYKSYVLAVH